MKIRKLSLFEHTKSRHDLENSNGGYDSSETWKGSSRGDCLGYHWSSQKEYRLDTVSSCPVATCNSSLCGLNNGQCRYEPQFIALPRAYNPAQKPTSCLDNESFSDCLPEEQGSGEGKDTCRYYLYVTLGKSASFVTGTTPVLRYGAPVNMLVYR